MSLYHYSRWDGSQSLPPFDADDLLSALSDDLLAEGDLERAVQRLMQRGMTGTRGGDMPGLRPVLEQLRTRRAAELAASNLEGTLADLGRRLDEVVALERNGIARRLADASRQAIAAEAGAARDQATLGEQVLQRAAAKRRERLDGLPPDAAGRLRGLREYEFMDAEARDAFAALTEELRRHALQAQFPSLKAGIAGVTPEQLHGVRAMVRDLNDLLERQVAGTATPADFATFMVRHGAFFPPGIETLEQLIDHLHAQASRMESLLVSLSPEMRAELRHALEELLRDDRLAWDLTRLAGSLRALRPDEPFGEAHAFSGDDPLGLPDAMAAIERQERYAALEEQLDGVRTPEALERIDPAELRDLAGDDAAADLDQLRALTRALEEAGYLHRDGDRLELTARAARKLGTQALAEIFGRLRRDTLGGHQLPAPGHGGEPGDETKQLEHGDPFVVDLNRTLFNAMVRNGPGTPVRMTAADFEVHRAEETTVSSTVLLLDMSRSMLLRGCSTAAKRVAMALHTLIHTRYPRDRLYVVGFAYYARQIKPEAIATLSPYEFEYGTNLQHALVIARQLLGRRSGGNKEIVVITDGEPTAHMANGQVEFAYPPTARTMQSTLREVGRATREGIVINTFMLERSRYLTEFVDLMSRINRGRAFYVEPEHLGEYLLVDYVSRKRKRVA